MEPTTPNSAATEHAIDVNAGPRGSDATERAAIRTHDEWRSDSPHATAVVTQPPSTCYLCKGPGNVEAWRENAGTIAICSTTWSMHVCMFRQTYAYAVQVCHNCYEACPYTTQEELRLDALLHGDAKQMAALLHAVFVASTLPSNAARKITDYVFPLMAEVQKFSWPKFSGLLATTRIPKICIIHGHVWLPERLCRRRGCNAPVEVARVDG